jgi:ABC-type lipoprotein release transport system permease subunit
VSPTLIVRSDQVDAAGRRLHELGRPSDVDPDDWAEAYRSPVDRAARVMVSQQGAEVLTEELDALGIDTRDLRTATGERDQVGNRAARWTFEYLRLLAVVAAIAAVGTLLFYLSERRAARRLSTAMALQMGLRRSTAQLAAIVEVLGLVVLALVSGTITALLLAARVFARFEPDPRIPPSVGIQLSAPLFGVIVVISLTTVVLSAVVSQRAASRQSYAEVLRGS